MYKELFLDEADFFFKLYTILQIANMFQFEYMLCF